jgi:hypothetical protein
MNLVDDGSILSEEGVPEEWLYQIFEVASHDKKSSSSQARSTLPRTRTAAKAELLLTHGGR